MSDFNIEGHEFSDSDIDVVLVSQPGGTVELGLKEDVDAVLIRRSDAIALAKHFCII